MPKIVALSTGRFVDPGPCDFSRVFPNRARRIVVHAKCVRLCNRSPHSFFAGTSNWTVSSSLKTHKWCRSFTPFTWIQISGRIQRSSTLHVLLIPKGRSPSPNTSCHSAWGGGCVWARCSLGWNSFCSSHLSFIRSIFVYRKARRCPVWKVTRELPSVQMPSGYVWRPALWSGIRSLRISGQRGATEFWRLRARWLKAFPTRYIDNSEQHVLKYHHRKTYHQISDPFGCAFKVFILILVLIIKCYSFCN